jgi:hypothetical protein
MIISWARPICRGNHEDTDSNLLITNAQRNCSAHWPKKPTVGVSSLSPAPELTVRWKKRGMGGGAVTIMTNLSEPSHHCSSWAPSRS